MDKVLVIGSYNEGLWVVGGRLPKPGETVIGDHFDMGPGGKGSNQAIQVARLGGDVEFMVKIGKDVFGEEATRLFEKEGIHTDYLKIDPEVHTGAGVICVDDEGQNLISVAPGANFRLTPEELDETPGLFDGCKYLLMVLEIPISVVYHATEKAREKGVTVILNPAPAQQLDPKYLAMIDILTPNETETEVITGMAVTDVPSAMAAGRKLVDQGVGTALITMGKAGSVLVSKDQEKHFPAPEVKPVDTTGAGDAFNGGLVYALAAGKSLEEAIEFASKVGAYSVLSMGVVPGLATIKDIEDTFGQA
jgi:ribokinase